MEAQAIKQTQGYVTIKDLELLQRELKLWTVGLMISGFVLIASFITFLDNRTQKRLDGIEQKMETRFQTMEQKMETRFQTMEARFGVMEMRFQTIEKDIKTILLILAPNQLGKSQARSKSQVLNQLRASQARSKSQALNQLGTSQARSKSQALNQLGTNQADTKPQAPTRKISQN